MASALDFAKLIEMRLLLFIFWLAGINAHAGQSEGFTTGYRVLHASPQEIVSALNSPVPQGVSRTAQARASRMLKYFRIRRKSTDGTTVTMQVAPEFPLIGNEFADVNSITLRFTEINRTQDSFTYNVHIGASEDRSLDTTMIIEPHVSGSLLTLKLPSKSVWTKAFSQVALSMGFLEKSREAADLKDK